MASKNGFRIRPVQGIKALSRFLVDPDETAQVDLIVQAFEGSAPRRITERARRTPEGARLLRNKPDLPAALRDRERLGALPEGTLGRVYLDFVERYRITGDGLMDILSKEGAQHGYTRYLTEDELFLVQWSRNTHDLVHVLAGYETDLLGEAATLTFSNAQDRNPGLGVLVAALNLLIPLVAPPRYRFFLIDAFKRGRRAKWYLVQNWVELLEQPLARVRRDLRIDEPPSYEPFFSPKFRNRFVRTQTRA